MSSADRAALLVPPPPPLFHPFLSDSSEASGWPFVILDGGMATELERLGHDLRTDLWSAACVQDARGCADIQRVHRMYMEAGADIVTTCSYQASVPGFVRVLGVSPAAAQSYMRRLVELAVEARDAYWSEITYERQHEHEHVQHTHSALARERRRPLVAISVGCFGACLAHGEEYTGDYGTHSIDHVLTFQLDRIRELCAVPGADLLLLETLPNGAELQALLPHLTSVCSSLPVAFSFSCRPRTTLLRDGTPFHTVVRALAEHEWGCERSPASSARVVAIGVNCVRPDDVVALLHEAQRVIHDVLMMQRQPSPSSSRTRACIPLLLAYPNSGERYDGEQRCWIDGDRATMLREWGEHAVQWYHAGARLIGGCCRTTADHIRETRAVLTSHAHVHQAAEAVPASSSLASL